MPSTTACRSGRKKWRCCHERRENALLTAAVNQDASDIFLIPGMPAAFKIHGQIEPIDERKILPGEMDHFIRAIYALTGGRDMERVLRTGDDDFSFSAPGSGPQ